MKVFTVSFLLVIFSWSANASIIGTQVACDIEPSILWECDNRISVAQENNSEFNILLMGNAYFSVNFESDSLLISNLQSNLQLRANELLSFSLLPNLFSASDFDLITAVVGFDASDIDFDGELLAFNLHNTRWSSQDYILLNFTNNAAAVSNAPTVLLFLIGVIALRSRLRTRQKSLLRKTT
ncbi:MULTISPECIES: hypothetical protein [Alteromonadaceae]|uniref:hypothetical protein n=1 Tax=Alteromonadaceae TaxID=72275 RepID=UPI001C0A2694|nr:MULTISPECIES: hypothetical protein [Aliiglaciecola]MBU2879246.1 hypothetical protein [Aliiglaciecola lipolytica]MDO6710215.1 hypothetical protein [Aliiglaciecola sp. 2_MG-2023]MDO6751363.1 hypothetical protein [Aliiglaciecola sp. 1_MG-2023]